MSAINSLSCLKKYPVITAFLALMLTACGGSSTSAPNPMMFNLDFAVFLKGLPDTYGAASGQTGKWDDVPLGTTTALINTHGTATSVSIVLAGGADQFGMPTTDDGILLRDSVVNNNSNPPFDPFSATLTGLQDGQYTVYYYYHSPTFGLKINGTAVTKLTGGSPDSLGAQGTNWSIATGVTVTGGTLTIVNDYTDYDGLSGIQLWRVP